MKQTMKRLTAWVLTLALSLGLTQTRIWAAAANHVQTNTITYVNPLYRDVVDECDLIQSQPFANSQTDTDSIPYCDTVEEAGTVIREQLKTHTAAIQVRCSLSDYENNDHLINDFFEQATAHTGVPTEGDYLLWQYGGWQCSILLSSECELTYIRHLLHHPAQEAAMDSAVSSLRPAVLEWKKRL